jgi:hypothetical protein
VFLTFYPLWGEGGGVEQLDSVPQLSYLCSKISPVLFGGGATGLRPLSPQGAQTHPGCVTLLLRDSAFLKTDYVQNAFCTIKITVAVKLSNCLSRYKS